MRCGTRATATPIPGSRSIGSASWTVSGSIPDDANRIRATNAANWGDLPAGRGLDSTAPRSQDAAPSTTSIGWHSACECDHCRAVVSRRAAEVRMQMTKSRTQAVACFRLLVALGSSGCADEAGHRRLREYRQLPVPVPDSLFARRDIGTQRGREQGGRGIMFYSLDACASRDGACS